MYEAASKQLPFPRGRRRGTDLERWPQLEGEAAPLPPKVSRAAAAAIMPCLERDPGGRPTPEALFEAFDDLAARQGKRRRRLSRRSA